MLLSLNQQIATCRKIKITAQVELQVYVHKRTNIMTPDRMAELNAERDPTLPCVLDNHDLTALIPGVRAKGTTGSRKDRKKKVRNRNKKI